MSGPLWSGEDPARKMSSSSSSSSSGPPEAPDGWLPPTDAPPPPDAFAPPPPASEPADEPPAAWPGAEEPRGWAPPAGAPAPPLEPGPGAGPGAARSRPAGVTSVAFGPRVGAAVIDFFVRLAIVLAASVIGAIGYVADADTGEATVNIAGIIGFVAALSYAPLMIARTGGQTVGHRAVQTRIVRRDGTLLTAGAAGVREVLVKGVLFEGLAVFLLFIPTLLNYLWPLWDADKETLHDKVCSTRVVDA